MTADGEGDLSLKSWIGFIAMSGGTFMAVLDTQIVSSSLPEIAASLGATIREASWIQTAYMIAEAIMIPLTGWLSRLLSLRYLYALACALFTLTSLLCAGCWSIESLIVVRVLQGAFSGILTPLLYQGIYLLFPRGRQATATVYVVFVISLAPIVGPTLGGWITQTYSWRWLFLLNVLPGMVVTASALGLLPRGDGLKRGILKEFDLWGIVLAALFLGSLEFVLGEGPDADWFDSRLISFFAAAAAVSVLLMVWRELTCRYPVINLRTFGDRNFSTGCLFNFVMGVGLYGSGYLMTMFLSAVRGYNSLQIGHVMAVPGITMMLFLPAVRLLRPYLDARARIAAGMVLFGYALWMNASLTFDTGFEELLVPQILRGLSIILGVSAVTELALGRLPPEMVANASGLYTLMRSLGGGIGIAVINTLLDRRIGLHYWRLAESLKYDRFSQYLEQVQGAFEMRMPDQDLSGQGGAKLFALLARRESVVMACNDLWLMVAILFGIMILLIPLVRKPGTAS